ncbi:hypothetical protein WR25_17240 isoform B [Diploscapter pachys]|uniref:guanylate cyclase n=1 Tax=Diploscapter pachys TaxID=2018661 RepID=A0A2A2LVH7_9BILA|nr:hypothetical protein WR25_17240 isoform B [Diploscapter pachys]
MRLLHLLGALISSKIFFLLNLVLFCLVNAIVDNTFSSKTRIIRAKNGRQVILPFNVLSVLPKEPSEYNRYGLLIDRARPVFDVAAEDVVKKNLMPEGWINFTFVDDRMYEQISLAERWATIELFRAYYENRLDAIIGFADNYGLATVAKVSAGLRQGIPIITTIGIVSQLGSRMDFPFLTRMRGTDKALSATVYEIFGYHNVSADRNSSSPPFQYTKVGLFFHAKRNARNRAIQQEEEESQYVSTDCYFVLQSINKFFHKSHPIYKNWKQNIPHVAFDETLEYKNKIREWLRDLSMNANVIILCASPDTVREIMLAAHDLGMATSGDYGVINIDVSTGSHAERPWLMNNDTNSDENEKAKEAYKALKTISLRRSELEEYRNFETRVKKRAEEKYHYSKTTGKEYEMNNFISAFYDAVLLYAIALNETIANGLDPRNGHNITSSMWGRTFVGITGNVSIDANGDRYSDYSLLDLDPVQEKFVEVAYYSGATNELKKVSDFHWVGGRPPSDMPICGYDKSKCPKGYPLHVYLLMGAAGLILLLCALFSASGGDTSWNRSSLRCPGRSPGMICRAKMGRRRISKRRAKAKGKSTMGSCRKAILSSDPTPDAPPPQTSSGATRKISAIIDRKWSIFTRKKSSPNGDKNGGIVGNHVDRIKEVEDGECSPLNEVQFQLPLDRRVSSPSANSDAKKKSSNEDDFDNAAKKSLSLRNRKLSFAGSNSCGSIETIQQNATQIYTKTVVYKGTLVALKKLNIDLKKYPRFDLTRTQLMELKRMKDLQNEHITRFTGACLEHPHYYIVTEYCPKGSLEDILENEKIELDNMFKISLLHDLVKGMHFLHNSEIRSHGRLKSSNCVVDSRFVLKITDFGLHSIHAMEEKDNIEELGEHAYYKKKLWTSPELLRMGSLAPPIGNQKGDVYSFAIILHEMLFRKGVFNLEDESISPKEIVDRLTKIPTSVEDDLFRPFVPEQSDSDQEKIDPVRKFPQQVFQTKQN